MTFSHLTLGEPRLKGRVNAPVTPPCTEEAVTGPSLLGDGGFENWDSLHSRTEFTRHKSGTSGDLVWPSAPTTVIKAWEFGGNIVPYHWIEAPGILFGGGSAAWTLSTANPDTGTYHARVAMGSGSSRLFPNVYMHCAQPDLDFFANTHIFPVTPGLIVDVSSRAMADSANGQGIYRIFITGWDASMESSVTVGVTPENLLTTSYATYTRSEVIPSGVAYLQITLQAQVEQFSPAPTGNVTIDLDGVVLGIE